MQMVTVTWLMAVVAPVRGSTNYRREKKTVKIKTLVSWDEGSSDTLRVDTGCDCYTGVKTIVSSHHLALSFPLSTPRMVGLHLTLPTQVQV